MKLLAIDTETTGLDPFHGCMPYFVTTCDQDDNQLYWEWDVDVKTRKPIIPPEDLMEIKKLIDSADVLIFQNSKFDMRMLDTLDFDWDWDWSKIHELSISSHILASSQNKDLTTLALVYLGVNIEPYDKAVEEATQKARRIVRTKAFKAEHGDWAIASDEREAMDMPSGSNWKADMWLLRALLKHAPDFVPEWGTWLDGEPIEDHPWNDLTEVYANWDSLVTVHIFEEHQERIIQKGLTKLYEHRRELLPLVYKIEKTGVTVSNTRKTELIERFDKESEEASRRCKVLSEGKITNLPLSGTTKEIKEVLFNDFGLVSTRKTDKGNASVDKHQLADWLDELPSKSKPSLFLRSLQSYRKRKTATSYLNSYERFGLPVFGDLVRIHPSLNMCGTVSLRWSSSNPNEQNISKQEEANLRYVFGPDPRYFVWASLDYENLELRIPAYESGEESQIELFEAPDKPPFYGSNHLLNFSVIYPDVWDPVLKEVGLENVGEQIKRRYKNSWYQKCKNGNFAVQYGAMERTGGDWSTADKAYGRLGCHSMLKSRFAKLDALNRWCIDQAKKTGFVETIPDKTVDPTRGYPLECARTRYGQIMPTVPLNRHVQGTACWVINMAMLYVDSFFQEINRGKHWTKCWSIVMQIHDELVVQGPKGPGMKGILREVQRLMTTCGDNINVPLRVGCDIHKVHYAKGVSLC